MRSFWLLVAAATIAESGPRSGIHRLPITRRTVGIDPRTMIGDTYERQHPNMVEGQRPLVQRFFEPMNYNEGISKNTPKLNNDLLPSNREDCTVYWSYYTTTVRIGNPPLSLTAIIDTYWSTFFVPSANCTSKSCRIHPLYNSSLSSTYRPDLTPVELDYFGYDTVGAFGYISKDSFHISDLELEDQVFEEATKWYPGTSAGNKYFDTVLGLAPHPIPSFWGNFSAAGPFQSMIEQGLLNRNIFSLILPITDNEQGELIFGGLPENVTRESLIEVPLNNTDPEEAGDTWDSQRDRWHLSVEKITMVSTLLQSTISILDRHPIAIVMLSYPYIGLPYNAAQKANELIGLRDGRTWVDCDTRSSLPSLVISFSADKQITLTARDYLLETYNVTSKKVTCMSRFVELGGDDTWMILGAPFLNSLYSVFDVDRKSISFGNRAH